MNMGLLDCHELVVAESLEEFDLGLKLFENSLLQLNGDIIRPDFAFRQVFEAV
jgi:hypothetical protein